MLDICTSLLDCTHLCSFVWLMSSHCTYSRLVSFHYLLSLSCALVTCLWNFPEHSFFSYLSFCDCHSQWGESFSYPAMRITSNYCPRESSTFMVLWARYLLNCKSVLLVFSWIVAYILHTIAACNALMFTDSLLKVACQQWAKLTSQRLLL